MRATLGAIALSLFSAATLNAEIPINPNTYRSARPDPQQSIASFHYMSGVSKTDFRSSGETTLLTTFSITSPGTYVLVQDIGFQGRSDATGTGANTAIYIDSDDVTLDLGGKTLYQDVTTTSQNGIEIAASKRNICIRNGNIAEFQSAGIYARNNTDNIRIQDVTVTQCDMHGIYLVGTADTSSSDQNMITNCVIENCVVGRTTGVSTTDAYGIQMDECFNILVNNCVFNRCDTGSLAADAIGAYVKSCTNVIFNNCDASGNRGDDAYGFKVDTSSVACSFINCTANGNWGEHASANGAGYGFYADTVNGCVWENCTASGNEGSITGHGFYYGTAKYCKTTGCEAYNNRGGSKGTTNAHGSRGFYSTSGSGNLWDNCVAAGQQSTSPDTDVMCIGFDFQTETYSILRNCESRNNGDNGDTPWAVGINLVSATNCQVDNCKVFNNRTATDAKGYGIRDTAATSSTLVTNCLMFGNGDAGDDNNNFMVRYASPGELNITATVSAGGVGGIAEVKPFQNVSITP